MLCDESNDSLYVGLIQCIQILDRRILRNDLFFIFIAYHKMYATATTDSEFNL